MEFCKRLDIYIPYEAYKRNAILTICKTSTIIVLPALILYIVKNYNLDFVYIAPISIGTIGFILSFLFIVDKKDHQHKRPLSVYATINNFKIVLSHPGFILCALILVLPSLIVDSIQSSSSFLIANFFSNHVSWYSIGIEISLLFYILFCFISVGIVHKKGVDFVCISGLIIFSCAVLSMLISILMNGKLLLLSYIVCIAGIAFMRGYNLKALLLFKREQIVAASSCIVVITNFASTNATRFTQYFYDATMTPYIIFISIHIIMIFIAYLVIELIKK